jgi:transposase
MAKFRSYFQEQGELIPAYFSALVPNDHPVRLISDIVDQLDLSELEASYSHRGEEAYHPALMFKILFYGYSQGIFTSRKLEKAIEENIPFRWLCGGLRPDHRTISDFRKNNLALLPKIFTQIIQISQKLGYISLEHVSIDGSKIKANASKHKAMSRKRMKEEIQRLEKEIKEELEKAQQKDDDYEKAVHSSEIFIEDKQQRLEKIKEALIQLEEQKPESNSKKPDKDQISFTDSDSRIMPTKNQGVIQGYNPQIAVDEDRGFIVGYKMSNATNDQNQFEDVLSSIEEHTGQIPDKASADAGYFSASNINAAEDMGVDAYIAPSREGKSKNNPYDKTNFTYLPEEDKYTCPVGKDLTLKSTQNANNPHKITKWVYECQACKECPFQSECATAKSGKRTVTRAEDDPTREAMRTKVQSTSGKEVYRKRKAIVEPIWGQMKQCQGFRQFNLRGSEKTEGEFVLLVISHNLRKLCFAQNSKKSSMEQRDKSAQKQEKAA